MTMITPRPLARGSKGFTLIELMITVAIIAILGRVALGAYQDSVLKGKRAQGRAAIAELLLQEERYMTQRNCYLGFSSTTSGATVVNYNSGECGTTPTFSSSNPFPFKYYSGENVANSAYLLSVARCSSGTFADCMQVTATPQSTDAQVGNLQATSTGTKTCTGTAASSNPKLCWP